MGREAQTEQYYGDSNSGGTRKVDDNGTATDELPLIQSSRNVKWWYSAFHNVTAMVGSGVLGLPYAMSQLGWGPGTTIHVIAWVVSLYAAWEMVEMHEMVPRRRFVRYLELAQHPFGEKPGLIIVVPLQLIAEGGADIVYMVTAGTSLKKFQELVCKDCKDIKLTYFIIIFGCVQFVLAHLPNVLSIPCVSLVAAIIPLVYSTIAWFASLMKGVQPDVQYGYKAKTSTGTMFSFFKALGEIAFAYGGHSVMLEIQSTIPSTPENPSKGPMWKGVVVAYIVVAFCNFSVALFGFWIYGNAVSDNILISLEKPTWLIAMANLFVFVQVTRSYQMHAIPVYDMIETVLVNNMNITPSFKLGFITRTVYVALTMFLGILFPYFGALMGLFGGFAMAHFLPCMIWLKINKPKRWSLSWSTNWVCIVFSVALMIVSLIGGLRQIVVDIKTHTLFH